MVLHFNKNNLTRYKEVVAGSICSQHVSQEYIFHNSTGSPVIYLRQLKLILPKNKVNNWLNFQGPISSVRLSWKE